MRLTLLSASTALMFLGLAADSHALQSAPSDAYHTPIGAQNPSQASQPFQLRTRDENGNRIVINGRPVSSGGSTLSSNGSLNGGSFGFGTMRSTSQGTTLAQSTLSAVSIANSVSINNVRNSTIIINQTNSGEVNSTINTSPVANDNGGDGN